MDDNVERARGDRKNAKAANAALDFGANFFQRVNAEALAHIDAWVPDLLPRAARQATAAWRVSSADLGRRFEEDLSIHPGGIQDFGPETSLTPIDLVMQYGGAGDAATAALWLCDRMDIAPATIGWRSSNTKLGCSPLGALPKSEWPEPQPLPDGLPPVAPFDFDLMPEALREYAEDIAETMQAPPDYAAVAAMVGLGSVIGRKVGVRPQENTMWTEVANQWGVVIGRPGVMKSPAIRAALAPMDTLIARAQTNFETAGARHKIEACVAKLRGEEKARLAKYRLKQSGPDTPITDFFSDDDEPDEPHLRRYRTSDATPAALGELLLGNPNGLLVPGRKAAPLSGR